MGIEKVEHNAQPLKHTVSTYTQSLLPQRILYRNQKPSSPKTQIVAPPRYVLHQQTNWDKILSNLFKLCKNLPGVLGDL